MGTGIKGFKSQKILKSKLNGYSEGQSADIEKFVTVQQLTGDKYGLDTVIHGGFQVDGVVRTVESGSNIRVLKITGHNAQKGDFVRFKLSGIEASILSIPDADTIILGSELSFDPTGLELLICRHITPSYNPDGSLNVLASQGPVQFNKDGSIVEVNEDSASVADNKPLPSGLMIKKDDGKYYPVTLDTASSNKNIPIPTVITDLNGNIATVNSNGEIKVNGSGATQPISATSLPLPIGAATQTTLAAINTKTPALDANNFSPVALHGIEDSGNSVYVPLGANATFTGAWRDCTDFVSVALGVYTDQDSATNGLKYQFSADGINVHHEHSYTYLASSNGTGYSVPIEFRFYRVVYTNGTVAQTVLRIISTLKQSALFPSSYKITQSIGDQTQALMTRSVIVGQTTAQGGGYVNVKVNSSGALTTETTLSASSGTRIGTVAIDQTTDGTTNKVSVGNFPSGFTVSQATATNLKTQAEAYQGGVAVSSTNPLQVTLANTGANTNALKVDGSSVTQPVSITHTGQYAQSLTINSSSATTLSAPTGAKKAKIMVSDTNTANLRVTTDGSTVATSTVGFQFQPGRSEDFEGVGNLSVIAEGTGITGQVIFVHWSKQ